MCEILRKFDINNLYICPPYLYTVTTLPWEGVITLPPHGSCAYVPDHNVAS